MTQKIADYDKANYNYVNYWKDKKVNREYEENAEELAIKKLLPFKQQDWLCDIGAGFGRLFPIYKESFKNVIISDYSLNNLKTAKKNIKLTSGTNLYFVALNAYNLPFKERSINYLLSIRLMHHIENVPSAINEMNRVLTTKGKLILEYANKKHFLAVLRHLFKKGKVNPFNLEPEKQGELFYNFHPSYMESVVQEGGFNILKILSVSNLRHKIFKKILGLKLMLLKENFLQTFFARIKFGPSIFMLLQKNENDYTENKINNIEDVLACPNCKSTNLHFSEKIIECKSCKKKYPIIDGIYDLREN
jgi:ubiquinone/menaquinone biosynthesis C-methylase UbiE